MTSYHSLADDYYVNMNLSTEMELPSNRETVLHFFEQLQKVYPAMRNFYARENRDFVLEEDKDRPSHRWCTVESRRICSGFVNPDQIEAAMDQHRKALEIAPYALSVSPLDCEALDLLMGFDFSYRGNQNQLLAEALGVSPALEGVASIPGSTIINNEPSITVALNDDCRLQCRVSFEARTNAFQIRTGDFQDDQLSVYITARHYGSLPSGQTYIDTLERLQQVCRRVVDDYASEAILQPLARAIALG